MSTDAGERQPVTVGELIAVLRYGLRVLRRHRRLAIILLALTLVLSLGAALATPKKYSVTVRILTKRSVIIPSLVSPNRPVPLDSDRPTRGAVETIRSQAFRGELFDATNLPVLAGENLPTRQRIEARIATAIWGKADPMKVRTGLIELLGRSIQAEVVDDRVLQVTVSWSSPKVAHILAQELVDLFLRRQKAAELDEIYDTVDIIQRNAGRAHTRLTEATNRLTELVKRKEVELTRRLTVRGTREQRTVSFRRPAAAAPGEGTVRDRQSQAQEIRRKERELRRLADQHEQRQARAERQLKRLQESLGPRHPDLIAATREVEEARPVPEEITALQEEIAALRGAEARAGTGANERVARFEVVQMPLSEDVFNAMQTDPEVSHMMGEVRKYATEYGTQLDRLEAAELEIEMANAAFAYRYTVTQPPVYPRKPVSSKRKLVLVIGLFLGVLLTLLVCLARDLTSGRVRGRWQIERLLGVRMLGSVRFVGRLRIED